MHIADSIGQTARQIGERMQSAATHAGKGAAPAAQATPTAAVSNPTPTRADLERSADRIQQAGPATAKQQQLATELEPLDAASRSTLMAILAEREGLDNGTPSDWFSARAVGDATKAGDLTQAQQGLIAESFAGAYNHGAGVCLVDPSTAIDQTTARAFLDPNTPFGDYTNNVNRINEFLRAGGGAAMDEFLSTYSVEELRWAMSNPLQGVWTVEQTEAVVHMLAGAGTSKITADVLRQLDPAQREQVYDLLSSPTGSFFTDGSEPKAIRGWASSDDALSILFESVGRQPGLGEPMYVPGVPYQIGRHDSANAYDELAVEMARYVGANEDAFLSGGDAIGPRAEAVADLLRGHTQAVLDTLTDPRFGRFTPGSSNYTPEMLADLQTLGTLTRLTMLSDELPAWKADAVRDELVAYANAQIAAAPGPDGAPSPTGRVAMLLTAMQDGVKQGYKGLEDDRAAQERVVGFFTDVLVGQAAKGAGTLVPGGQLAQVVGGALIDLASAEGKSLLREGITDLLFGAFDTSDQDVVQAAVNDLVGQFVQGLPDGQEIDIGNFMNGVGEALDDTRD